jgi:UDP-N-acetyl-D-glucosamine dehydrogenase
VPTLRHNGASLTCAPDLAQALADADCVMIVTDHSVYDWADIAQSARLVVDTRNVLALSGAKAA